jgi:hypothetical protein
MLEDHRRVSLVGRNKSHISVTEKDSSLIREKEAIMVAFTVSRIFLSFPPLKNYTTLCKEMSLRLNQSGM